MKKKRLHPNRNLKKKEKKKRLILLLILSYLLILYTSFFTHIMRVFIGFSNFLFYFVMLTNSMRLNVMNRCGNDQYYANDII